jgi:hypothetical protein
MDEPEEAPARAGSPVASRDKRQGATARVSSARRRRLVRRLWATAEGHVAEIEKRLALLDAEPATLERDAKTLAVVARTVRELAGLDADLNTPAAEDIDAGPRDLASFRAELERLVESRAAAGHCGGDA